MNHASKLLNRAVSHVKEMADSAKPVTDDTIHQAVQGMSNIIAAATSMVPNMPEQDVTDSSDRSQDRMPPLFSSSIVMSSQSSLHIVLKMKLKQRTVGEEPLKLNTEQLAVYAGQFKKKHSVELDSKHCNFKLPPNMDGVLDDSTTLKNVTEEIVITTSDIGKDPDCYEVHAVTYRNNPYLQGGIGKVINAALIMYFSHLSFIFKNHSRQLF